MSERKCKYCGGKNAIYYNELINAHYCSYCSQLAYEELVELIDKTADYIHRHEEEADG